MNAALTTAGAEVTARGVTKRFGVRGQPVTVLDDVDLRIAPGEFVSVIGPSGCGKSTLLRIIAGLLDADEGSVAINGEAVPQAIRHKAMGLVPQTPALLPWRSVRDNVLLPTQVNTAANAGRNLLDVDELLTSFGLGKDLRKYPRQLSGGMQQRVAIARAFVFDPPVLLMDEPFSALDEITRDQQRLGLLDFWQSNRRSVMFITHSVPEAILLSDRVVLMAARPGRIAEITEIDLPRPRDESVFLSPQFREYEIRIREGLRRVMKNAED
ncbi:ABC transporter ATP-binding protein [Nocardioides sp. L-11A]|uniref:ABC transporter ATP-binding protein n=1 Tax=Nocardioides sp. L-11A TaxID=3043848 RepID=UPI00249A37CB|nr:ABC transporter ATP-binding protein [Nocardioides sp. L-11A]